MEPENNPKRKRKNETKKEMLMRWKIEDRQAKALGISYGKYQALKSRGRLPPDIPIPEKSDTEKRLTLHKISKQEYDKMKRMDALRDKRMRIWDIQDMKDISRKGQMYAERYMDILRRHSEAQRVIKTPEHVRSPNDERGN